ncbi:MAG TPA: response regulator [Bryobacteraceae bacterium]|jgi:CheY-like chemotaxis protein
MRILLADDDRDQLALRSLLLVRSGFETLEAADRNSAMELAASQKPECAVIDLRFPTEEIGLRLIRELKDLNSSMHLFVLTGGDPDRFSRRPERKLVDCVIVKGSSSAYLVEELRSLAARKAAAC